MNVSDLKIWGMLERHEFISVVAFGASNTQRYLPGTHWFDYVEMAFKNQFGGGCGHFVNSGISGNTTVDLLNRFDRQCAFYKPDLVIMTIGGKFICDGKEAPCQLLMSPDVRSLNVLLRKLGVSDG